MKRNEDQMKVKHGETKMKQNKDEQIKEQQVR